MRLGDYLASAPGARAAALDVLRSASTVDQHDTGIG
ncbi:hypothetical protein JOM49_005937 [Amycolatopsis magusensis]|uniref:Uncharacterized protein n=1 Tax=Amycolatopsis magusensis TaxID=882444 RepID=A0ABS4PYA9_9PSEU|nr:hypothetical protein [Amycolatopsis magusensis]